jgi:hypothetical protein
MVDREFWMQIRHALLILLGAIEKMLDIKPTTKELREAYGKRSD